MHFFWNLLSSPWYLLESVPRRLAALSLPGRIAACVAVFQLLVVILGTMLVILGDGTQVFEAWWRPGKLALLLLLLVLTPFLVYQAAWYWLERDLSRFPDILEAWQGALVELHRQGIQTQDVPLFVVLGTRSDDEEQRLMEQSPFEFQVSAAPEGAAALHVYGDHDGLFVSLASCSRLSDVVRHRERRPAVHGAAEPTTPVAAARGQSGGDIRGTVMVSPPDGDVAAAAPAAQPAADRRAAISFAGVDPSKTIDVGSLLSQQAEPPAAGDHAVHRSSPNDRDITKERLAYFCGLLRRERGSVAALNGVLAIVPGDAILNGQLESQTVGQALGDDLSVLVTTTGVRTPVVTLVLGMEREPGFVELIRRMPESQRGQRVGHRYATGAVASHEQLGSLSVRGCGHVEDLVTGHLFRAATILSESNNDRLARLVARLRTELAGRLTIVLRKALLAAEGESTGMAPFLAGCYFAACGPQQESQGFVRGVIDRLIDCQGDLEWTQDELTNDGIAGRLARILWVFSGVVLASLAIVMLWRSVGS